MVNIKNMGIFDLIFNLQSCKSQGGMSVIKKQKLGIYNFFKLGCVMEMAAIMKVVLYHD